jgi:signal transduction histidine kinase
MRDEILGIVSHDLRNPLSAISMCARALEEDIGARDPRALEVASTIHEAANLMHRLISDLLDVASIDAGRLSIESKPSDIVIAIVQAAEVFERTAAEREVTLAIDVPDDLPTVEADAERVVQVLSNLLGNALKFTQPGGRVTLRAQTDGPDITVSVADTGCGISSADLPRVFDRFWHSRGSSKARGTGLGLAISRGIITAHGGRIWAESEVGKGSTFHFTLPAVNGPRQAQP